MKESDLTDEQLLELYEKLADDAAGYYLGLWNILKKDQAPPAVIINGAINNMLAILDYYMAKDTMLQTLENVLGRVSEEQSLSSNKSH